MVLLLHPNFFMKYLITYLPYVACRSLSYTWELPQNLLGWMVSLVVRRRIMGRECIQGRQFIEVRDFGLSLGHYIFWSRIPVDASTPDNRAHEYGHALQSRYLGPFYLLLVGLPSLLRAVYARYYFEIRHRVWKPYHHGYPERWANRLGERYGARLNKTT